jgi:hypothetical protein
MNDGRLVRMVFHTVDETVICRQYWQYPRKLHQSSLNLHYSLHAVKTYNS